jgi:hypothetical protein
VEDVHFHHDSAVLLPDYGDAPDATRVTGLSEVRSAASASMEEAEDFLMGTV